MMFSKLRPISEYQHFLKFQVLLLIQQYNIFFKIPGYEVLHIVSPMFLMIKN